ncbi:hypothetical protein TrVE_jg11743 [Triparma verrucosa]|uniref:Uncharacterized protein n=2 Tax=Triparma TaxID=722752 RepID=A0A9W7E6I7_9STRA|nr:hypothetical protein TrST_g2061 [Triparma strigata]GMI08084.1 hypothetical protein TrVE_jg11743 [Triparma verrucosa]
MVLSDTTNVPTAKRTEKLKTVMSKALAESRKVIDEAVVKDIYGELATPELNELIGEVLDGVTDRAEKEFGTILENYGVNDKLLRLEEIVEECKSASASTAPSTTPVQNFAALLPDGVTPQDVLRMNAHEMKLAERERLIAEITALEQEGKDVEGEIEEGKKALAAKMQDIERQRMNLQKTADLCTMTA